MTLLIVGIAVWSLVHFIPGLLPGFRNQLQQNMGEKGYQIAFSISIVASIALMVIGWRSAEQWNLYDPAEWARPFAILLVLIAFVLIGLTQAKTNVKRFIRHPQLAGMIVWAIAHLIANGDNLSVTLFGSLGLWAFIEIFLINRREGTWKKPGPLPLSAEIWPILPGLVVFAVFFAAHPYLIGVSPIPR